MSLTTRAPRHEPPATGRFESRSSRDTRFVVLVGGDRVELRAFLRVGVWTTLQRVHGVSFTLRESWGRLGERSPRRLAQVEEQLVAGVIARLRPNGDGSLSFVLEVSAASRGAARPVGEFHGEPVTMEQPRRHGYRFAGRAPARWTGLVAHWPGAVAAWLGEAGEPPGDGVVAGKEAEAEAFVETWDPVDPVHTRADGIERTEFRLRRTRKAAGLRPDHKGWYNTYGARFHISVDRGFLRFSPVGAGAGAQDPR